jgi:CheY-like chemotaxis protein
MTMAEQLPETGGERARLLFVDDEQRVLNSMRIMFRRQFDLFLASHGAEALDIVKDKNIDVIVADHRMPRMTGVEVLSRVRAMSPRTVRILLTGYADLDAVEGSINESEVFRFLTKPCAPKQLRETIELAARSPRGAGAKPRAVATTPRNHHGGRHGHGGRRETKQSEAAARSERARRAYRSHGGAAVRPRSRPAARRPAASKLATGLGIVVFSATTKSSTRSRRRCAGGCPSTTRATSCTSSRSSQSTGRACS